MNIFRWSGEYFGFVRRGYLFSRDGRYFGWTDNDLRVWKSNGEFLGQLVDEKYILRRDLMLPPIPRIPKAPPIPPIPPIPPMNHIGRIPKLGWTDALDDFSE